MLKLGIPCRQLCGCALAWADEHLLYTRYSGFLLQLCSQAQMTPQLL